jgi:hypothetical protein
MDYGLLAVGENSNFKRGTQMLCKTGFEYCRFRFAPVLAAALAFTALTFTAAASARDSATQSSQKEVSQLFEQVNRVAVQLERDAATLESYTRVGVSWRAHADKLEEIKTHINTMGEDAKRLQELRPSAASRQQQAIDRVIPLMMEMASLTESSIAHLENSGQTRQTPEYVKYVKDKAEVSRELSRLLGDFVKYDQARAKLGELEKSLGTAGS